MSMIICKYEQGSHVCYTRLDEIITPHQTTLLKLVDSYLQSIQLNATTILKPEVVQTHVALGPFLAKCFFSLSMYAQNAIRRSLGDSEPNHPTSSNRISSGQAASLPAELDVMLPKVCEALVLVAQCTATISLEAAEQKMCQDRGDLSVASVANMKEFFIEATSSSGQGLVESLIGTGAQSFFMTCPLTFIFLEVLRMLDLFLPRINFGKPVSSSGLPNSQATSVASSVDSTGFSYLKRDLVRLLGVLCHEVRAVQDRIRMADGIPVVMNLCVVDERNPCMSPHCHLVVKIVTFS
jgi:ataxin-10